MIRLPKSSETATSQFAHVSKQQRHHFQSTNPWRTTARRGIEAGTSEILYPDLGSNA